ncbi:MAG: putative rane protein [Herbinix sp.]|jgi:glycopeptide antibiotics resistance protein|nr:putative rane protein [Herbinix sp.]
MKAGVKMQRRTNIQVSSLIILLSIITILSQFVIYYFFAANYVIWGAAIVASLLCCHILLEQTSNYEACFNYSSLILFISFVIMLLSYFGKSQSLLPYTGTMLGIGIINWLIPCLYCFLRNMLDYSTRFEDYNMFYRNHSLLFFIIYLCVMIYGMFVEGAFPLAYQGTLETANIIPFEAITILIEDYLYGIIPLSDVLVYLLVRILIFLPYGFQLTLLLRRQSRLLRFIVLLLLPVIIEIFQYFIISYRSDIDDVIYAMIGGILGSILFYLCNLIFRAFTGKNFLAKDADYPFANSRIHF